MPRPFSPPPIFWGGPGVGRLTDAFQVRIAAVERLGQDLLVIGYPDRATAGFAAEASPR